MVTIFNIITTTTILPTQLSQFLPPLVILLALWKDLHKYKHLVEQIVVLVPAIMNRYVEFESVFLSCLPCLSLLHPISLSLSFSLFSLSLFPRSCLSSLPAFLSLLSSLPPSVPLFFFNSFSFFLCFLSLFPSFLPSLSLLPSLSCLSSSPSFPPFPFLFPFPFFLF